MFKKMLIHKTQLLTEKELNKEQKEWIDGVVKILQENGGKHISHLCRLCSYVERGNEIRVDFDFILENPQEPQDELVFVFSGDDIGYKKTLQRIFTLDSATTEWPFYKATNNICNELLAYGKEHPFKDVFNKEQKAEKEL